VPDTMLVLTTLRDLGWHPTIVSSPAIANYGPVIVKTTGGDVFKDVISLTYSGLAYCSNDPVGGSPFAKFIQKINAFAPDAVGKLAPALAVTWYDAVYLMKTAVEGVHAIDGPTVAPWIEEHASDVKMITLVPSASKASHHLFGLSSMVA